MCITNHYLTLNTILFILKPPIIQTTYEAEMKWWKTLKVYFWQSTFMYCKC